MANVVPFLRFFGKHMIWHLLRSICLAFLKCGGKETGCQFLNSMVSYECGDLNWFIRLTCVMWITSLECLIKIQLVLLNNVVKVLIERKLSFLIEKCFYLIREKKYCWNLYFKGIVPFFEIMFVCRSKLSCKIYSVGSTLLDEKSR